jgi:hypothetical protein
MQFQVPQFIDVEDKIFGPFTFKQFIYLVGGGGASFALYKLLPIYFSVPLILIVAPLALALTFYKVNNRPFIAIMESAFNYYIGAKLYIWKQNRKAKKKEEETPKDDVSLSNFNYVPKLSNSKLKDLSWSLDVLDMEKKNKQ